MSHVLKNVFWIKSKNLNGTINFFPVTFNKNLTKIVLVKNNRNYMIPITVTRSEITKKLQECVENGACDFISLINLNLGFETVLYHAPKLYKYALKNSQFKKAPKGIVNFTLNEDCSFFEDFFEEFCATYELSKREIIKYGRAFKKATAYIDIEASNKRLDSLINGLNNTQNSKPIDDSDLDLMNEGTPKIEKKQIHRPIAFSCFYLPRENDTDSTTTPQENNNDKTL